MIKVSIATVTLTSITPMSQSRYHEEPKLKGELADDYGKRTWKNFASWNDEGFITIPADGLMKCFTYGAQYSKKQIPGQGKATWTAKFRSGVAITEQIVTNFHKDNLVCESIFANADGVSGSGKRVMRYYPTIPAWEATFPVTIIDQIITPEIFREIVDLAGMFIGMGRWRPQNGGQKGRFKISDLKWEDNREFIPVRNGV